MLKKRLWVVMCVCAFLSMAATCEKGSNAPSVIWPQEGQLLRGGDSFSVVMEVSPDVFDLDTLEVTLNGFPVDVELGESEHLGHLRTGQKLQGKNEIEVSAVRLRDGELATRSVEFQLSSLPSDLEFQSDYVSRPPPVLSADIELIDSSRSRQNAILHVRYRSGFSLPSRIPYRVDEETVYILNDEGTGPDEASGDGLYSSRIDFDYNRYALRKTRSLVGLGSARVAGEKALFEGRKLVLNEPANVGPDLLNILSASQGGVIPLFPLRSVGSALDEEQALLIRHPSVVADPNLTFDPCDIDDDGNLGNPDGPWTFKTLMTEMANESRTGITPEDFVRSWVSGWELDPVTGLDPVVNRDSVPARNVSSLLLGWEDAATGVLDLDRSPFRLLAIVNRVDLRDAVGYGGEGSAGELRFVFGLVDVNNAGNGSVPPGTNGGTTNQRGDGDEVLPPPGPTIDGICGTRRMTVIFEYKVKADSCQDVLTYAEAWEALDLDPGHSEFSSMEPDELADFVSDLQLITDSVVRADSAPGGPNANALGQLRTNEFIMGSPWEMREFTLRPQLSLEPSIPTLSDGTQLVPHLLKLDTTKQTPDLDFAREENDELQTLLANYINDESGDNTLRQICNEEHTVPLSVDGAGELLPARLPFLAGRADFMNGSVFNQSNTHFSAPGIQAWNGDSDDDRRCSAAEIRFNFSAATCTGCHGSDILDPTVDRAFYHVNPGQFDPEEGAGLSRFLTGTASTSPGTPIPDPSAYGGRPQHFSDLERRAQDMDALLDTQCLNLMVASQPASSFVH